MTSLKICLMSSDPNHQQHHSFSPFRVRRRSACTKSLRPLHFALYFLLVFTPKNGIRMLLPIDGKKPECPAWKSGVLHVSVPIAENFYLVRRLAKESKVRIVPAAVITAARREIVGSDSTFLFILHVISSVKC